MRARLPLSLVIGLAITLTMVAVALVSLVWTPHDPLAMDITARLRPPGTGALFGTDAYGRDVLSMIMAGARNALAVALAAASLGLLAGAPLGLAAAAFGGWVDDLIMRANDLVFAFPALLIAVMISALLGPGALNAIIAIANKAAMVLEKFAATNASMKATMIRQPTKRAQNTSSGTPY